MLISSKKKQKRNYTKPNYNSLTSRRKLSSRPIYNYFEKKDNSISDKNINDVCVNIDEFELKDENYQHNNYKNQSNISKYSKILRNIIGHEQIDNTNKEYLNV